MTTPDDHALLRRAIALAAKAREGATHRSGRC